VRGDLVEVEVDAAGCLEALPQVVAALEEPLAGPGSLAQWIVARRAAEDVRVLLSGCGGDELFSGYARHAALLQDAPPPGLERYAPLFARMAGLAPGRRALCGLNRRAPGLFTAEFLAAHPAPEEEFLESFAADGLHPLAAASRAELALTLPALLQVEDRIGMAFSLETRVPLLDRRLLRAASRLAPEQRIHDGNLKALLREAAAPLLPPAVAGRRDKMGFPLPLGEWFAGPWAGFAREVLLDRRTLARGMLDARGVKEALDGQGQYDRGLYAALLLELWHRTFIDG
jgi:asparagine synthase (glutamine-hydrolysing)